MPPHPLHMESLESRSLLTCVAGNWQPVTDVPDVPSVVSPNEWTTSSDSESALPEAPQVSSDPVPDQGEPVPPGEGIPDIPAGPAPTPPTVVTHTSTDLTEASDVDDEALAEQLRANHRRWGNYQGICGSALMEMARNYPQLYQQFLDAEQTLEDWLNEQATNESAEERRGAQQPSESHFASNCSSPSAEHCDAMFAALQQSIPSAQGRRGHAESRNAWADAYYSHLNWRYEDTGLGQGVLAERLPLGSRHGALPEVEWPTFEFDRFDPASWGSRVDTVQRGRLFHIHDRSVPGGYERSGVDKLGKPNVVHRSLLD